jgi:myo-inositol-1(or 4)-monophosphatase
MISLSALFEVHLMKTILRAAAEGGKIVKRHFRSQDIEVREKSVPGDLVSNVDMEVEERVLGILQKAFPDVAVISEEQGDDAIRAETFYVDAVDGTLNFVHGLSPFAVSIGYWKDGAPFAAAVHDPITGDVFSALRGGGARRNGKPISPSSAGSLRSSLVAAGWPYDRAERAALFSQMDRVYLSSQELRTIGCASLVLCYIAAGIFDGYWEWGLKPWDMAAGVLIVTEAGGRVSSLTGSDFRLEEGSIAASNGLIHAELVRTVNG